MPDTPSGDRPDGAALAHPAPDADADASADADGPAPLLLPQFVTWRDAGRLVARAWGASVVVCAALALLAWVGLRLFYDAMPSEAYQYALGVMPWSWMGWAVGGVLTGRVLSVAADADWWMVRTPRWAAASLTYAGRGATIAVALLLLVGGIDVTRAATMMRLLDTPRVQVGTEGPTRIFVFTPATTRLDTVFARPLEFPVPSSRQTMTVDNARVLEAVLRASREPRHQRLAARLGSPTTSGQPR